jgi:hypothetical protein
VANVKALAIWWYSVFRLPGAPAQLGYKSSLFILLSGVIRKPELQLNSEQKAENIFVTRHIANAMLHAVICLTTLPIHLPLFPNSLFR